jgi:signal transduction histidine kinase
MGFKIICIRPVPNFVQMAEVLREIMRIGIFLKILIPFLIALGASSYFYGHAANQGIEASFEELIDQRLVGIREGVGSEIKDMIERGESQLTGLAKVADVIIDLKNLKSGNTGVLVELYSKAKDERNVTGFDVLIFFDYAGWIATDGENLNSYNQPADSYGEETKRLVGRAIKCEDVASLRYLDLENQSVILSENFVPVKYKDEIVGAIWGGRILGKDFVDKLSQISASPLQIVAGNGTVVLSTLDAKGVISPANYVQRDIPLGEIVSGSDLSLRLYVPKASFKAAGAQLKKQIFGYGIITVVVLVIIAALIARSITIPIRRLTKAVEDLSRGKLGGEITVRSGDEIEQLVEGFNRMARDLDENTRRLLHAEKIAAWREVARRLAHEIKNPLSPIQLSIQSLMKNYERGGEDFGERLKQDGGTILEEVDRLRKLADEFSAFAKLPKPLMEESDLNELAENVARMHSDESGRIKLTTDFDKRLPKIKFDREQMKQVLINLVKNAFEAIEGEGRVRIGTKFYPKRNRVEVIIEDTGSGMTEEEMRQVFNPYFTTKRGGTGLGLAIALSIINDHGGRIWIESRKGAGTTFHVELRAG